MVTEVGLWSAGDAEDLFQIFGRVFGDQAAAAKRSTWAWQYEQNPGGSPERSVWVVRRNGRALGQIGTIPVSLWWGDREVRASWGIDYLVAREAEGQGHSIALVRAWMESVDVALAVGLTPISYLICKRLGFQDLGYVPFFQAVVDPSAIARRRLGRFGGAIAAPFLRAAMKTMRRRPVIDPQIEVRSAGEIGADYDTLWERARPGFAMCVRRDAAYVRWRYRGAPHKQYEILEARRGGTLLGFIVTRQVDHRGLRLGWIVDLFAACDDRSTKDALLATAMKRFSKDRVARAQAFCTNARLAVDLRRHGFFKGASPAHLCVRPRNISGDPVSRVDDWHIVYGDSDSDR